jgi:hypothetical protein
MTPRGSGVDMEGFLDSTFLDSMVKVREGRRSENSDVDRADSVVLVFARNGMVVVEGERRRPTDKVAGGGESRTD